MRNASRALLWPTLYALVGGVFVLASIPKILDPAEFALSLGRFDVLPDSALVPTALLLPWLELVAAVALIAVPRLREAAAALLVTLLIAFSGALLIDIFRGTAVPCGCFGEWLGIFSRPEVGLARNVVLLGIAIAVFGRECRASYLSSGG